MIIAIDIETAGLDARKFVVACLMKENGKTKVFYKKEDLWNYIIDLGMKEKKRKKVLTIYSHNAQYDFYGYANVKDRNLKWYSHRPFIVSYMNGDKEIIKFLDTLSIYKMPLQKIGEIIGLKKMEMPMELKRIKKMKKYLKKLLHSVIIKKINLRRN